MRSGRVVRDWYLPDQQNGMRQDETIVEVYGHRCGKRETGQHQDDGVWHSFSMISLGVFTVLFRLEARWLAS